jgi:hypothetical protein
MFNNLESGKVYWVKHKCLIGTYDGPKKDVTHSSLVRIDKKLVDKDYIDAYEVYPVGWDIPYKIHIEDILDVSLVENPFKDAMEDA